MKSRWPIEAWEKLKAKSGRIASRRNCCYEKGGRYQKKGLRSQVGRVLRPNAQVGFRWRDLKSGPLVLINWTSPLDTFGKNGFGSNEKPKQGCYG